MKICDRPRESVERFARRMEIALRRNDHKGGWEAMRLGALFKRLDEERNELQDAIADFLAYNSVGDSADRLDSLDRIINEAADVANFAMMITDRARRLP